MSGTEASRHHAFVSLGSNIQPERHLPWAVACLSRFGDVTALSTVYESPPVDGSDQANYLNAAVLLLTERSAEQLCLESLPAIEAELGRVRDPHNRYAARTIDVDLVLYDAQMLTIGHRQIPDPEIALRPFLAVPLAELRGDWKVPPGGVTLDQLAAPHRAIGTLTARPDVVLRSRDGIVNRRTDGAAEGVV